AIRKRKLPFPKGLDGNVVAQLGAHLFHIAPHQVIGGDQLPIAVSRRDLDSVDRRSLSVSLSRCRGHVGGRAGQYAGRNQSENNSFHLLPPYERGAVSFPLTSSPQR